MIQFFVFFSEKDLILYLDHQNAHLQMRVIQFKDHNRYFCDFFHFWIFKQLLQLFIQTLRGKCSSFLPPIRTYKVFDYYLHFHIDRKSPSSVRNCLLVNCQLIIQYHQRFLLLYHEFYRIESSYFSRSTSSSPVTKCSPRDRIQAI